MASYLKILPMFIIIFPGMASRVLYTDRVGCADPEKCKEICGSESGCTNIAYAELVIKLMPPGRRHVLFLLYFVTMVEVKITIGKLTLNVFFSFVRLNWTDAVCHVSSSDELVNFNF